jgi:hypothetical protein
MSVAEQRGEAVLAVMADCRTVPKVAKDWLVIRGDSA